METIKQSVGIDIWNNINNNFRSSIRVICNNSVSYNIHTMALRNIRYAVGNDITHIVRQYGEKEL